ncbi:uncharacterized protein F5147DRAFT_785070 [Suillus discolor]|uniref:Uncharacterized protein n=1 Tax=Suillus discolor TaxID=1912936 RepID=A0A9P7JKP5_9AGAM|nr:uncharacterized protein F5147DRAFT_785070 [Suillus discolor]KAG2079439.1 hypothetical protein F5147DRAFT_785070 [Suillus discolor]
MSTAEGLLLVHILALWHNNRKIKLFLLASYWFIVVAMVICDILLALLLENICGPTLTPMGSEFMKMEDLIMGKFISAALFELTVITLIMYHSIRLRSDGIRSIGRVTSTLLKGSLLYQSAMTNQPVRVVMDPNEKYIVNSALDGKIYVWGLNAALKTTDNDHSADEGSIKFDCKAEGKSSALPFGVVSHFSRDEFHLPWDTYR